MARPLTKRTPPAAAQPVEGSLSPGLFLQRLSEGCWLAACLLIPLFYDPHTFSPFQPPKAGLLQILSGITVFAWLGLLVLHRPVWREACAALRPWWRQPALWALTLGTVATLVSTLCSIAPWQSWWGSVDDWQETATRLAKLVLLVSVATGLRSAVQLNRLIAVIVVASLPVAIYAMLQRAGWDPVPFTKTSFESRVFSTVGHPIYLAGYLLMVLPLTAPWACAFYGGLAALQLAAFFCTESRGPLVALAVTVLVFLAGLRIVFRTRVPLRWIVIGVAGFAALLLAAGVATHFQFGRYGRLLPFREGPDAFRSNLWRQAPKLMLTATPLPFPTSGVDPLHRLRCWIGYGPETLARVLPHYYSTPGAQPRLENRFHNLIWDTWFSTGLLGVAGLAATVLTVFRAAFQSLGVVGSPARARSYYGSMAVGAVLGGFAFYRAFDAGFSALGAMLGSLAGLIGFAALAGQRNAPPIQEEPNRGMALLTVALCAALAGFLADSAFAFETMANGVLASVFVGLILNFSARKEFWSAAAVGADPAPRETKLPSAEWAAAECTLWPALVSVTLCFGFISLYFLRPFPTLEVLGVTLLHLPQTEQPSPLIPLLLLPALLGAAVTGALHGPVGWRPSRLFRSCAFALVTACVYAVFQSWHIARIGPLPEIGAAPETALHQGAQYARNSLIIVDLVVPGALLVFALEPAAARLSQGAKRWTIAGVILAVGLLCLAPTEALPWRASIAARWGQVLGGYGRWTAASANHRQAVRLSPRCPTFRMLLVNALLQEAADRAPGAREALLLEAEAEAHEAQRLTSGLSPANYALARLYLDWSTGETDAQRRRERAEQAAQAFGQALAFEPGFIPAWIESAALDQIFLGRPEDGREKLARVRTIAADQNQAEWGDFFRDRSFATRDAALKRHFTAAAAMFYEQGALRPSDAAYADHCEIGRGGMLLSLGDADAALTCFSRALQGPPTAETWQAETMLAQIYLGKDQKDAARQHLDRAIGLAPTERRTALLALRQQLGR